MITEITLTDEHLDMVLGDGRRVRHSYFWLRDHATDPGSYDERTHQRELFTAVVDPAITPLSASIVDDGGALQIEWPDAVSASVYSETFLAGCGREPEYNRGLLQKGVAWGGGNPVPDDRLRWTDAVDGDEALLIRSLVRHGFVVVEGCPVTTESVRQIADRLGGVQSTMFGDIWSFSADEAMADSAYTPKELRPHTDGTYSLYTPGLQMLLCCEYRAEGGESVLVDGLGIFETMRAESPELVETLRQVDVPGQYVGDGRHLLASRPVFRCDRAGHLQQVSFNNYDRAPFSLPEEEMQSFYKALTAFERLANDHARQWRCTLRPGDLMIFDNWRVLHGRGGFRGHRSMTGCYVSRDEFESRVRMLDLA